MAEVTAQFPACDVDPQKLADGFKFCVYIHRRPDGTPFYVGKGLRHRAMDLSPSRRSEWHGSIVAKYGRENIAIEIIPCENEMFALELEKAHIAACKTIGHSLCNMTLGGEGCSGRPVSEKQIAALSLGRRKGKRGTPGPRPQLEAWINSESGKSHMQALHEKLRGRPRQRNHNVVCAQCGVEFMAANATARCCSRKCEQRNRRARGGN